MSQFVRSSCQCLFLAVLGIAALSPFAWGQKAAQPIPASLLAAADPQVRKVTAANTGFGLQMMGLLSQNTPGNVFFSPFGVSSALTMVLGGAGGDTRRDMASALGLGTMTPDQITQANALLLPSLTQADPSVELTVASALWAGRDTAFSPAFQQTASLSHAHVETLDFASPSAADTINGWVKGNTKGKIDHLVSSPDLVGATGVLTNAVYFHGTWQNKFVKTATQDGLFRLEDGTTKTLPLMAQVETFSYLDTSDFQAVGLPYGTGRLSLYVFLPKPGRSLDGFVNGLTANSWEGWMGKMQAAKVNITLPRFKVSYQAPLNQPLMALGMASAFTAGADFTPIGLQSPSGQGSFLTGVVHKAILEVDENGTVAAAATGVFASGGGGFAHPPAVMRVDHPFFCAIRDNVTGTLLFVGAIRNPN